MPVRLTPFAAGVFALLAACSTHGPFGSGAQEPDYIVNAGDIVKAANWNKTETVTLELSEHSYHPAELKLRANQPYKLVLKNVGEKEHYFTADEFFKSVATRKAMVASPKKIAEVKAPYFTAMEIYKESEMEFYFVPVKKGSYKFFCTIDDHRDKGMEGSIVVE